MTKFAVAIPKLATPDGEIMTDVCGEFGVSRKTGNKIFDRYKEHGLTGADHADRCATPTNCRNRSKA